MPSNAGRIRSDHEASWSGFKRELLRGGRQVPAAAATTGGRRRGVSAIVRPTAEVASRLAGVAGELADLTGPGQLAFDASNVHTTLYAFEGGPAANDGTEARRFADAFADVLRSVALHHGRFCIGYEGLTAGPTGVLAQGWPSGDRLQDLRRAVHRRLAEGRGTRGFLASAAGAQLRQTAHATLVSFVEPIENPASLARFVDANRSTRYGATSFRSVELVSYEATERGVTLVPLARIPLG